MLKPDRIRMDKWNGYKNVRNGHYKAYLNVEVTDWSEKQRSVWEEFSGYPGLRLKMVRSEKVKVKYETEKKFEDKEEEIEGFQATIFQQAHNHLEAIDPLMLAEDFEILDESLRK